MKYENKIMLSGKTYHVMVVDGERYVDGMPIGEFIETLSLPDLALLAIKGLNQESK